ncbi:MAG TPA: hypothetical protein VEX86_11555 [Longimicrobium sp.]|nr:hypothetical protein [Longimicrobium sp.]
MKRIPGCIVMTLVLGACSLGTDGEAREPGIVASAALKTPVLVAPTTVAAGQTFQVTVTTLGLHSCYRAGGADVTLAATEARIRPYDHIATIDCKQGELLLSRTVALHFDTPGTARIVVEGQNDPRLGQISIVRVEQTVTVQ